jgi:hypothetical protein
LPDVKLEFEYVDTEGKENKTTQAVVDLICKYVVVRIAEQKKFDFIRVNFDQDKNGSFIAEDNYWGINMVAPYI